MLCPNCKTENLVTSESHNIQIDHCPRCRGVWLDRGELEKLIQMSPGEDGRQAEGYNGRQYGEDEEEAPRKRGYGEEQQDDDDDSRESERGGSYQSREKDDDSGNDRTGTYRSRERDDDSGNQRTDTYRNRERYDERGGRTEQEGGKSIWREIFENLGDKLPLPRL